MGFGMLGLDDIYLVVSGVVGVGEAVEGETAQHDCLFKIRPPNKTYYVFHPRAHIEREAYISTWTTSDKINAG